MSVFAGVHMPSLDEATGWLNSEPLGPAELRGHVVLVNVNPFTEAKVDPRNPDRGPLLIIEGEKDHTVSRAIAHAAYKRQKHNESVTEITSDAKGDSDRDRDDFDR